MFILAQIIGFLAFIVYSSCYWQKKRTMMLFFQIGDGTLYSLHYLLLGATSGALVNLIAIFRALCFSLKGKNKFFSTPAMPVFFCVLYALTLFFTYDGIVSLLPVIAVIVLCVVTWQSDEKAIRFGSLFVAFVWLAYNFFVSSYIGIITESIIIVSTLLAIGIYKRTTPQFCDVELSV